jgi:superfamily II DNA or RNA helicase
LINLRDYQEYAINALRAKIAEGFRSVLLVMPTGSGKTCCAAAVMHGAVDQGSKLLFISHRREHLIQCYQKMLDSGIDENNLGIIMGDGKITLRSGRVVYAARKHAPIQIASIDTLRNRYKPEADIVFRDEAHRCLSKSDMDLKNQYPKAYHIGLTATPFRFGGKGLGSYYSAMVIGATPSALIEQGWIEKPFVWTVPNNQLPDLSSVKTRNGDYAEEQLEEVCNTRQLVGSIVEHWKKHAEGRRTICFAVSIEHAKRIVEDFLASGIPAEHLDGKTPDAERDAILSRLENGTTLVCVNVGVLVEGLDIPNIKCCILARPTKSTGLLMQQAGRILRPWKDEHGNRITAIILDHAGCILEHGMPTEDREYTLEDQKPKRKGMSTKTCMQCFAVVESIHKECPACGAEFPIKERDVDRTITHVDGQLVEYQYDHEAKLKKDYWTTLCAEGSKNGYQPGWAKKTFKERYGHYPPKSWPGAYSRPMTAGEAEVMRARLQRVAETKGIPQGWVDRKMESVVVQAPAAAEPVVSPPPPAPAKQEDLFANPAAAKTVSREPEKASVELNPEAIVRWEI